MKGVKKRQRSKCDQTIGWCQIIISVQWPKLEKRPHSTVIDGFSNPLFERDQLILSDTVQCDAKQQSAVKPIKAISEKKQKNSRRGGCGYLRIWSELSNTEGDGVDLLVAVNIETDGCLQILQSVKPSLSNGYAVGENNGRDSSPKPPFRRRLPLWQESELVTHW